MSVCKSLSFGAGVIFSASPSISQASTVWAQLLLSAVVSIVWIVCSWWLSSCISRSPWFWCSVSVCGTSPGEASIPRRGSSGGLCQQVNGGVLAVVNYFASLSSLRHMLCGHCCYCVLRFPQSGCLQLVASRAFHGLCMFVNRGVLAAIQFLRHRLSLLRFLQGLSCFGRFCTHNWIAVQISSFSYKCLRRAAGFFSGPGWVSISLPRLVVVLAIFSEVVR